MARILIKKERLITLNQLIKFLHDWRVFLIFLIFVGLLNTVFVVAQLANQEIKQLQNLPPTPRRTGPFYAKGIYISSWTASEESMVDQLINLIQKKGLNAVVIDIKDSTGWVAYNSQVPQIKVWGTQQIRIKNIEDLLKKFRSKKIYTIARIAVFQDPVLAEKKPIFALKDKRNGKIWRDNKGLSWVDPACQEVWDYNIALAREAFTLGFDEVNFDYIRFPSDGQISNIIYPAWDGQAPKYEIIRRFFEYQYKELKDLGPRSADLFGMTFWHTDTGFDMNIGQRLVDALDYFDYVCPMLYPSHFPDNFNGFKNPAEYPYEVINTSLKKAEPIFIDSEGKRREKPKIRPWLQAFDIGAIYTPEMIQKEKQAVIDNQGYGWIFWNARNDYSTVR